jgi:ribonucleoside-diphosphate reductase alpha chain
MKALNERKQTFNYNEALQASVKYFDGDELAASTWLNKYAMRDFNGELLEQTPADMHRRMAKEFARIESEYIKIEKPSSALSSYGKERVELTEERIFNLFDHFKYIIPQGSVMTALGNPYMIASLSNCIVLPEIHDSYGGIFYADQQLAQLFKRRCGAGLDISSIRPEGMRVSNAAGSTTGAVSFMDRFSNTTREVAQHGRRGALMITMDIAHPDIEKFISIKQDLKRVTGANISVRLSDEFMLAVEEKQEFTLRFPVDAKEPLIRKEIDGKKLWETIIKCAHNTAEPGLIFWDRQHYYSTSSVYPGFKNVSTNPCSEIAMQGGDSCRLIAINLFNFVNNPFTENASFDYKKFYEVTYESQRLMDDLVDLELEAINRILEKAERDPEPDHIKDTEIRTWKLLYETGKKGRRTGLGFTALADALAALNLSFDSDEALVIVNKIMQTKCAAEFDSSIDLAIERSPFTGFNPQVENTSGFVLMMKEEFPEIYSRMMKHGRRNISLSTVAPTGTLSLLAQTSSGIEPVYMLSYNRRRKISGSDKNARIDFTDDLGDEWQEFTVHHPGLKKWMKINNSEDVKKSSYYGATAVDIDWKRRIRLQSVVQKYTTHSISSTINLPAEVSEKQVGEIYFEAWKAGLKGITVYRDGSRSGVLVSGDEKKTISGTGTILRADAPERPKSLEASVLRFRNESEKWIAFVGLLNDQPYEIFTGRIQDSFSIPDEVQKGWIIKNRGADGKSRYDFEYADNTGRRVTVNGLSQSFDKEFWNYAKLLSGVLRHGMPLPRVIHLIEELHLFDENINTWKAGVKRALKRFIPDGSPVVDRQCPECGDPQGLIFEEGCLKCVNCGNTKCG